VRLAYADPPYPGQAKRHYSDHPDYGGEVNHAALIDRLAEYDGWALSTSAVALQEVLALCPSDVRIGIWHQINSGHPGFTGNWWWMWEPVIFQPARPPKMPTRNLISTHIIKGWVEDPAMGRNSITGQKPSPFCNWVFALLGADEGDDFTDLYPGSGAVGRAWEAWRSQLVIA
jgi:hypothetical protein